MNDAANEVLKPVYPGTRCIKVPNEWIMDGMEVFSGSSTGNVKRLAPAIDAGYVTLTENFLGRTLYRNVDAEATLAIEGNPVVYGYAYGNDPSGIDAEATLNAGGRVVYQDTNNSTQDFHERSVQSLHTGVR